VFVFDVDVQYFGSIYQALNCALLFNYLSLTMQMCHHVALICAVTKQPSHFFFLSVVRLFLLAEDAGSHKN